MPEPETYLVLDAEGAVVNAVVWDGETPWDPGGGREVLRHADLPERARTQGVGIGWQRGEGGAWEDKRPERPDPDTPAPTPPAPGPPA